MRRFIASLAVLLGGVTTRLHGSNPGGEVVVVYNTRLPESKAIAEFYAQQRQVPKNQIFGFALPLTEDMPRREFRDSLQKPLAKTLTDKKLWRMGSHVRQTPDHRSDRPSWSVVESKIRYAVLCYGVPLKILKDPTLKEEEPSKIRPELRRDEASVDSELSLLPCVEQKLPLYGPLGNPVYGVTNANLIDPTNGVLMVSRLDGPSPDLARGLVGKAIQAETDGLWGRAYFDLRGIKEPAYKSGDDWLRNAGEICRRLGFETVVDESSATFPAGFPMSHIAFYMGWYSANADGPFAQPVVEFMPGAFAYHLHSFSADTLRSTNKAWVGPFVAKGATITMGCVYEPYLDGTPEIAVFVARLIYSAFTFGEAAYASQATLSWQTTVVGDPLYRPFGVGPEKRQQSLRERHSTLLPWSYLRLVDMNLANGSRIADAVAYLEQLELTKQSAVLLEKLADLYAAQGKPSSAAHTYAQALNLNPSPQQRARLLLTLGEKLTALEREPEALDFYKQLLKEVPKYPDKLAIYNKLLGLAQKLDRKGEAEKYEALIRAETSTSKP